MKNYEIKHKIKEKPGKLTKEKEVGQRKQENFCTSGIFKSFEKKTDILKN
jgi:hypothetical protein